MSEKEAQELEEMFDVTDALRDLLDDGKDADSLVEARRLASHANREVRRSALSAMRWIGADAVAEMIPFMSDPDAEIRAEAERAFWQAVSTLNDAALQLEMLETALQFSSPSMRMRAMDEMAFLPEYLTFSSVASMLNDQDEDVRSTAADHLLYIAGEKFVSEEEAMLWFGENQADLESFYQE